MYSMIYSFPFYIAGTTDSVGCSFKFVVLLRLPASPTAQHCHAVPSLYQASPTMPCILLV